jgi:Insulinase (Peptidase family M16)
MLRVDRIGRVLIGLLVTGLLAPDAAICSSQREVLENGLSVILDARSDEDLISVNTQYLAGSGSDPEGKEGLAHLVEHLMFTSADGYESGGLRATLDLYATRFNAHTAAFRTTYETSCLSSFDRSQVTIEVAFPARAIGPTDVRWADMELFLSCLQGVVERELRHRRGIVYYVWTKLQRHHGRAHSSSSRRRARTSQ